MLRAAVLLATCTALATAASTSRLASAGGSQPFSFGLGAGPGRAIYADGAVDGAVDMRNSTAWAWVRSLPYPLPNGATATTDTFTQKPGQGARGPVVEVVKTTTAYTSPTGGTEVRLTFRNAGSAPTPAICGVNVVDGALELGARPQLHMFAGSHASRLDYLPATLPIAASGPIHGGGGPKSMVGSCQGLPLPRPSCLSRFFLFLVWECRRARACARVCTRMRVCVAPRSPRRALH